MEIGCGRRFTGRFLAGAGGRRVDVGARVGREALRTIPKKKNRIVHKVAKGRWKRRRPSGYLHGAARTLVQAAVEQHGHDLFGDAAALLGRGGAPQRRHHHVRQQEQVDVHVAPQRRQTRPEDVGRPPVSAHLHEKPISGHLWWTAWKEKDEEGMSECGTLSMRCPVQVMSQPA